MRGQIGAPRLAGLQSDRILLTRYGAVGLPRPPAEWRPLWSRGDSQAFTEATPGDDPE